MTYSTTESENPLQKTLMKWYPIYGVERIKLEGIPDFLKNCHRWVCWKALYKGPDKKPGKLPIAATTGRAAESNNDTTWAEFDEAVDYARAKNLAGIGFQFGTYEGSDLTGLDLDNVIDEHGDMNPLAKELLEQLDSYTEISPSGRGTKTWLFSDELPGKYENYLERAGLKIKIETCNHNRFFCMTGHALPYGEGKIQQRTEPYKALLVELGCLREPKKLKTRTAASGETKTVYVSNDLQIEADRIRAALGYLDSDPEGTYTRIGMALKRWGHEAKSDALARSLWDEWSKTSSKFDAIEQDNRWNRFSTSGVGIGSVFHEAEAEGYVYGEARRADGTCYEVETSWVGSAEEAAAMDQQLKDEWDTIRYISSLTQRPITRPSEDKPWRKVTTGQVKEAIQGTRLGTLVEVMASVTRPALPLELTLPKAIAVAGTALSQARDDSWKVSFDGFGDCKGPKHLRYKINTAGGQACNIYAMIVAESGIGKDIGNVAQNLASMGGFLLGSSGSSEGLKDALSEKGAALITVSELGSYLDARRWQYHCTEFFTAAWNQGWFEERLSKASTNGHVRRSAFCYPSILANIQPALLQASGVGNLMHNGFLQRFLVSTVKSGQVWRPTVAQIDYGPAGLAMEAYKAVEGSADLPQDYLADVLQEFIDGKAVISHFTRLVNEYAPRIAAMLAADPLHISSDDLAKAGLIIRWFYAMWEDVFGQVEEDRETREVNKLVAKFTDWLRDQGGKAPMRIFTQRFSRVVGCRRKQVLSQMADDGQIRIEETPDKGRLICLS